MKKIIILLTLPVILAMSTSCDNANNNSFDTNTIEGRIKQSFSVWAKENVSEKYKIQSISYSKSKTPLDYLYIGTMLCETVGSSGKTTREVETGYSLIMLDNVLDSTYLTTPIRVAKISVVSKAKTHNYYVGLRGDNICTEPKLNRYEALTTTHKSGEQYIYDACRDISKAMLLYASSLGATSSKNINSDDEYYEFWMGLPTYEEAIKAVGNK